MNWISVTEKLPTLNEEYIVAIDFEDGMNTLGSFAAEFDAKRKKWCWSNTEEECQGKVLFWCEKPAAPVINWDKKVFESEPRSLDDYERITYGQCIHGENMATCTKCRSKENVYFERK